MYILSSNHERTKNINAKNIVKRMDKQSLHMLSEFPIYFLLSLRLEPLLSSFYLLYAICIEPNVMYSPILMERKRLQEEIFELEDAQARTGFLLNGVRISRASEQQIPKLITCVHCLEEVKVEEPLRRCPNCRRKNRKKETASLPPSSLRSSPSWDQYKVKSHVPSSQELVRTTKRQELRDTPTFPPLSSSSNRDPQRTTISKKYTRFLEGESGLYYGDGAFPPLLEDRANYKWRRVLQSTYAMKKYKK